ncbi:hypothetical protein AGMMS50230_15330 [Spirochaetia bacterium]|nr:hypothetical protein AGMMS50230_15330 [Spirochaetia bacterium]
MSKIPGAYTFTLVLAACFALAFGCKPSSKVDQSDTEQLNQGQDVQAGQSGQSGGTAERVRVRIPIETAMSSTFGAYKAVTTPYAARVPNYQIVLAELDNLKVFQSRTNAAAVFTQANLGKLTSIHAFTQNETSTFYNSDPDGFTSRTDDWISLYGRYKGSTDPHYRQLDNSIFISTDFLAHLYHRLMEKQMEYLDREEFAPRLKTITLELLKDAKAFSQADNSENQESWQRVLSYLAVPAALLENAPTIEEAPAQSSSVENNDDTLENALKAAARLNLPSAVLDLANKELTKIFAGSSVEPSSIFGGLTPAFDMFDYTQFTPRSYYNKNIVLRSYFRAMMWYGRSGFALKSEELTRDALHLTSLLDDKELARYWQDIYEPTSFLVGTSDDLSFKDYIPFLPKASSGNQDSSGNRASVSKADIQKIQANASKFPTPLIFSDIVDNQKKNASDEELLLDSLGWRFMGQRFTPDGYIFDNLTQGAGPADPLTGQKLPSGISAAMVAAAMGSKTAETYLNQWVAEKFPASNKVVPNKVKELRTIFAAKDQSAWTQNSYWSWLYLYKSLIDNENKNWTGYPRFMSFNNWRSKDLNTVIGSWTELKHDTLLYAKQSYAEWGGGSEDPPEILPVPKGYVEPNIEFYDRLEALMTYVSAGLKSQNLLHREIETRTDRFLEQLQFYRRLAVAELANEKISDKDFEKLQSSIYYLDDIPAVLSGESQTEREARSAIIADVHTDALLGQVYYQAVGIPQTIYVAVKDANGARLTKGLVYSHYEFTEALGGKRLTDQDWQGYIYGPNRKPLPPLSPWSNPF